MGPELAATKLPLELGTLAEPTVEQFIRPNMVAPILTAQRRRCGQYGATMAERLDRLYADPAEDLFETFSSHERFHRRIAECTGCPALSEAIERNHILIFNWLYNSASQFNKLPSRWHQSLIEVLAKGDPGRADQKMREHGNSRFQRLQPLSPF